MHSEVFKKSFLFVGPFNAVVHGWIWGIVWQLMGPLYLKIGTTVSIFNGCSHNIHYNGNVKK